MRRLRRDEMVTVQQYLDQDARPVPSALRDHSEVLVPRPTVDTRRYWDPEFQRLEAERLWSRVWQWACNEEDIPEVGDHIVYDIADHSLIVMRSAPGEIRAFHNVCLHRGTQLRVDGGSVASLTCPFHAWSWHLDGSLANVPGWWDFPHVDAEGYALPEARVETWQGFVFVNLDRDAPPLADHLGEVLPAHFEQLFSQKRFTAVHVSKVVPANWKVVMEAFIESYHVIATHPQILEYTADLNTQYDIYGPHNRMITPFGVPSPHLDDPSEDEVAESMRGFHGFEPEKYPVEQYGTARAAAGQARREQMAALMGPAADGLSDAELLDAIEYFVFPNFAPWAGAGVPIMYRWRPNGNDPESCIMDVRLMPPCPPGVDIPAAPVQRLRVDQPWTDAPQLAGLAQIFEQDMSNLARVQRGMHASATGRVTLAQYQESRIRHVHDTLDHWLGLVP